MSSEMVIRNKASREMGYIRTSSSGKQTAYNKRREKLGCFDPKTNLTRDADNRVIGHGNILASLILASL